MNRDDINSMLRRNLKKGAAQYDKFIKRTTCKTFTSGEGTALDIIKVMQKTAQDHAHQVEGLANHLRTGNLKETVNKFYQFQRDYIQYDVDGYAQRLRSPSCAWYNRLKGMDCKSFAIFSSALCSSVGLFSYMRQIKQLETGDRISHVYTIVPIDQVTGSLKSGYYVLDASNLNNVEPLYNWKNDMKVLPYTGMNANVVSPTATCGCNSHSTNGMNAVSNNTVLLDAYKSLLKLTKALVNKGANAQNMQAALEATYYSIQKGKEPIISIGKHGISVNGNKYPFNLALGMNSTSFLNLGGLSGGTAAAAANASAAASTSSPSGGFDIGSVLGGLDFGSLFGGGGSGGDLGGALGTGAGAALGGPIGAGLGGAVGGIVDTILNGGGTGSCGLVFENERLKGDSNFHNQVISMKWRDADYVLAYFNDTLLNYGWKLNHCPSSPAQGIYKKAEDAFFSVLKSFLDEVIAGKTGLPESLSNDQVITNYLNSKGAYTVNQGGANTGNPFNPVNNTPVNNVPTVDVPQSDGPTNAGISTKTVLIGAGIITAIGAGTYAFKRFSN